MPSPVGRAANATLVATQVQVQVHMTD